MCAFVSAERIRSKGAPIGCQLVYSCCDEYRPVTGIVRPGGGGVEYDTAVPQPGTTVTMRAVAPPLRTDSQISATSSTKRRRRRKRGGVGTKTCRELSEMKNVPFRVATALAEEKSSVKNRPGGMR